MKREELRIICDKCDAEFDICEVVSMGLGYREYEDLTPILKCPDCGFERPMEISDTYPKEGICQINKF